MAERKYARKYLRIRPDDPINAEISIVQVGQDMVRTGSAHVRVIDICPGGLKFTTMLNLPVNDSVYLELHFQISDTSFRIKGYITHKDSTEIREYEYGFCFLDPDDTLRICLKKLLNSMYVRMERHIVFLRFN